MACQIRLPRLRPAKQYRVRLESELLQVARALMQLESELLQAARALTQLEPELLQAVRALTQLEPGLLQAARALTRMVMVYQKRQPGLRLAGRLRVQLSLAAVLVRLRLLPRRPESDLSQVRNAKKWFQNLQPRSLFS